MEQTGTADTASGRMAYIDNLRIFLTGLVFAHHQSIAFGAPGSWYYRVVAPEDIVSQVILTLFVAVNQAFFMSLFFFVAAYFTPVSLDKKGVGRFVRDRLARLGIPLLVFFFLLDPSLVYLVRLFEGRIEPGYLRFMATDMLDCAGPGPMWFVLTLLLFTAAYLALTLRRSAAARAIPLPNNRRILAFILTVGFITFLLRFVCPVGWELIGMQIGYFPLYIAMFTFGVLAFRQGWLDQLDERRANLWFRAALGCIVIFSITMLLLGGDGYAGGPNFIAFIYAMWEPFICVGISMKLLVFFRKRLDRTNGLTRRLSASAYTVYIIHPFFVIAGSRLARDLPLPPLALFLIVSPLAIAACFLCANIIRQAPLLKRIL